MAAEKNSVDIQKLSYAELSRLVKDAQSALVSRRSEEIKVLADAYAKKLLAADFSIQEGIEALRPYVQLSPRRAGGGGTGRTVPPKYRGPNGEEWSGRGRTPTWLAKLTASGDPIEKYRI